MPSDVFAYFLRVALDVQAPPYEGVHVEGGVAAATDGVMLVVARFSDEFLRGEGAISPKAAKVLAALAEATWVGRVEVDGNRVTVAARSTRYDETAGGEVAGEFQTVTLPEFYCRRAPISRMLGVLTDESRGWVHIVDAPKLKTVKEGSTKDFVALVDDPRSGEELFRPKRNGDERWYSVSQLRRGLRLFGRYSRLRVRRSASGWLAFEDQWGWTFAVTPFVKSD